jgi:hypothetical protein
MFNTTAAPMTNNSSQVQKGQEVNVVYKTYDLSMFKSIDGNRVPNLQHIKRLASSVKEYGMKCNPIIVNERYEVIDGQHRLAAAKEAETFVYYIMIKGYTLSEVHTLNLNQKNWTKKDFMDGYADMGIESYIKLRHFVNKNDDFLFSDCIGLCSNISSGLGGSSIIRRHRNSGTYNVSEVFEEGTWKGKDFNLAQEWANKIRMIKPYYNGYNRSSFVGVMITLFQNEKFDFNEFMHKVRLQPTALVDCANREQYRTLIEDIYNYRSRNKISLKY